ncbi:hypothetical protein OL229_04340 [Neisseriaceae bacterium JH1-16]|nr:hypothetical protein [Neisseriaceae bacterium JH1-16]
MAFVIRAFLQFGGYDWKRKLRSGCDYASAFPSSFQQKHGWWYMPHSFEGFNLSDEAEVLARKESSSKKLGVRGLNPQGQGIVFAVIDLAYGYTNENAEGVLGIIRDPGATTPKTLTDATQIANYVVQLQKVLDIPVAV